MVCKCPHLCKFDKTFGSHYTFIIKNNSYFFPQQPLYKILKACHRNKNQESGSIVEIDISELKLTAVTYLWYMKVISYFISTCGNTLPSKTLYWSNFEDEFVSMAFKETSLPEIGKFLYNYTPLAGDPHKKKK